MFRAQAGLKAVVGHPSLIVASIPRLDYEAGEAIRIGGCVSCEPGTVQVPCFISEDALEISWRSYKITSCILHRGHCLNSGHYRYLALSSGGYLLGDDYRPAEFLAFPTRDLSSDVYLVFLSKIVVEDEVID